MKNFTLTFTMLFLAAIFAQANTQATLWSENFDGDWTTNWYVEAGTWEVGTPTSGPNAAYSGDKCAATVLAGNYPVTADTRLIRFSSFTVPAANQNPRLRFWHWYSISTADYGKVQIKPEGSTEWVDISGQYVHTGSSVWTRPSLDLSDFAGQTVQIAFLFHAADAHPYNTESSGWYIDDITIDTGTPVYNNPETWESGSGDWAVDFGTWQVGEPTSGPNGAHNGTQCAATVLEGNYATTVNSRLISPNLTVPAANQNPRLRFWHWYSISTADYGKVQIKPEGSTEWVDISGQYVHTGSSVWTRPSLDLSDFAGQTVQIAFLFHAADAHPYNTESSGWYIDDITIDTGTPIYNNPETWESGLGDWAADFGTWQVGEPTYGPASAHGGQQCASTVLGGKYATTVNSRLISPNLTIPAANQNPRLRFWHWYSISTADYGKVQIKPEGSTEWVDISGNYVNTSGSVWTYAFIDLSDYGGQRVQIAFLFHAADAHPYNTESSGWYIDDIIIESDTKNNEADILSYSFGLPPQTGAASIDETNHTIDVEVEVGTDLTNLVATFTLSDGATAEIGGVPQVNGITVNDFSSPVTYTVTAEDGTSSQDWVITVNFSTGISMNLLQTFKVYPNPFQNNTTVEFGNSEHSKYRLIVYNVSGGKVFEMNNITSDKVELKRGSLKSGIYFIELKGEKTFQNKKVVIRE